MQTTLGQLVSELVETYERTYHDRELAALAASLTLEELFENNVARRTRDGLEGRARRQRSS